MKVGSWNVDPMRSVVIFVVLVAVGVSLGILATLGVLGALLIFWAVSLWPRWIHENAVYIGLVAWFATFYYVGSSTANQPFYEAVAQIIPVLFLALAVGSRFSLLGKVEPDRRVIIVTIYLLALGEWNALDALASGTPRGNAFAYVAASVAAVAVVVIGQFVGQDEESGGSGEAGPGSVNSG
jgi:hypothetical protein